MTRFESIQPLEVFQHAGVTAFRMGISKASNPYPPVSTRRGNPRDEWDNGYAAASQIEFEKEQARKEQERKDRPRPQGKGKPRQKPTQQMKPRHKQGGHRGK